MRFMMLVIPKGYESAPQDALPSADAVAKMMKYNEALAKAGVLLSLDGLVPPSAGARVSFSGGKPKVTDGPFAEAKEFLAGFWIVDVETTAQAHAIAARASAAPGKGGLPLNMPIEVRQVMTKPAEDL